jgi:hypothetical protein
MAFSVVECLQEILIEPIKVSVNSPVLSAIAAMSAAVKSKRHSITDVVVAVQEEEVKGIFHQQELIHLLAEERDLATLTIQEVMRDIPCVEEIQAEKICYLNNLFDLEEEQYICIISSDQKLRGLVSKDALQEKLKDLHQCVECRPSKNVGQSFFETKFNNSNNHIEQSCAPIDAVIEQGTQQFSSIIDSLPMAIAYADIHGKILFINQTYAD